MAKSNANDELLANFRVRKKQIKDKKDFLMERLRVIETEETRLRKELSELDEMAKTITDAVQISLAMSESNKENPGIYEDSLFDDFNDYDNQNEIRREEMYRNNNNRNMRDNRGNRDHRDIRGDLDNRNNDYINPPNRLNQNYSSNSYNNDSVAYLHNNRQRTVPNLAHNIEPLNQRFADRTITQACTLLLRERNSPLHVNDLYNFLVAGGFEFKGNNPTISIAVSLNRNRRFKKVAPGTFDLVMRDASQAAS